MKVCPRFHAKQVVYWIPNKEFVQLDDVGELCHDHYHYWYGLYSICEEVLRPLTKLERECLPKSKS